MLSELEPPVPTPPERLGLKSSDGERKKDGETATAESAKYHDMIGPLSSEG